VLPAYATFHTADVGEQVLYPDSAVASNMTLDEGNSLSKTPYSGSSLVKVGNGTLLPISSVGNLKLGTPSRPLRVNSILHVPQLRHSLMSFKQMCRDNNCILMILVFVLRTTPAEKSYCKHLVWAMSILFMLHRVTFLSILLLGSLGIVGIHILYTMELLFLILLVNLMLFS